MSTTPLIDIIDRKKTMNSELSDRVRKLLDKGKGNINERDIYGNTPLHYAAQKNGSNDIIRILLDYGTDINVTNSVKSTPLSIAVVYGNIMAVEFLIENGANLNTINKYGENLLFPASNIDILRLLIGRGLDINSRDSRGRTPLHSSIQDIPNFEKFLFLIENGADPNIKDSEGISPIEYAQENITIINHTLSKQGLKQKNIKDLEKQLKNNTQIIKILTTKMNGSIPPEPQILTKYSNDNEDEYKIPLENVSLVDEPFQKRAIQKPSEKRKKNNNNISLRQLDSFEKYLNKL
jgi:ankyrin repeat protein